MFAKADKGPVGFPAPKNGPPEAPSHKRGARLGAATPLARKILPRSFRVTLWSGCRRRMSCSAQPRPSTAWRSAGHAGEPAQDLHR
eukprot:4720803-Pyramimonas_sp.AAC.1